jgi:hypothetical protein
MNEDEDIEQYLDDQDEEEEMRDQLKIPSDLDEDDDDDYGGEDGRLDDENEEFEQFADDLDEDAENEVFRQARNNDEMNIEAAFNEKPKSYAN